MADLDLLLNNLGTQLGNSFKNAIVWEQRDMDLIGKYVYIKYEGKEVGIFMGYLVRERGSIKASITFLFAHPASGFNAVTDMTRIFHKLLIRFNLRLKTNRYKIVSGKSPAIIRTMPFSENGFSAEASMHFFTESVDIIKSCDPLYKAVSV